MSYTELHIAYKSICLPKKTSGKTNPSPNWHKEKRTHQ
uniref:Uncharacterized protein n=1 Tax=Anguilla anguilla TaxID=7936 RepID=A0A0E9SUM1_ANGAN